MEEHAGENRHSWERDLLGYLRDMGWLTPADALLLKAENEQLRAALGDAIDHMKDYRRTPISARATLNADIARLEAALSGSSTLDTATRTQ